MLIPVRSNGIRVRATSTRPARSPAVGSVKSAFPDPDVNFRVTQAECVGETSAGLLGAVGESPDGEGGRPGGGGDPGAGVLGVLEQGARLVVERGSRGRERDPARGAVYQQGADIGLELLNGPAQRRLGHVQAGGGAPEVALLGHRDEVAEASVGP